jgi:hypothetical protein
VNINQLIKKLRIFQSVILDTGTRGEAQSASQNPLLLLILQSIEAFKDNPKTSAENYLDKIEDGFELYDPKTNVIIKVGGVNNCSTQRR